MFEDTRPAEFDAAGDADAWAEFRIRPEAERLRVLRELRDGSQPVSLSGGGLIVDWPSYEAYRWPDVEAADYGVFDALGANPAEALPFKTCTRAFSCFTNSVMSRLAEMGLAGFASLKTSSRSARIFSVNADAVSANRSPIPAETVIISNRSAPPPISSRSRFT